MSVNRDMCERGSVYVHHLPEEGGRGGLAACGMEVRFKELFGRFCVDVVIYITVCMCAIWLPQLHVKK